MVAKPGVETEDFERVQSELEALKHLLEDRFNQLLQLIDKKADRTELDSLEKRIMDRLNELVKSLIDRFADKKDVFKRISSLEKQVCNSHYNYTIDQNAVRPYHEPGVKQEQGQ